MSNHHHQTGRTGRRTAGVVLALLLGPLATFALAEPASAAPGSNGPDGSSSNWHCRILPILC